MANRVWKRLVFQENDYMSIKGTLINYSYIGMLEKPSRSRDVSEVALLLHSSE